VSDLFFANPILNSPYEQPTRHWELDGDGQPTQQITDGRRPANYITPIPRPKTRRASESVEQLDIIINEGRGLSNAEQQYDPTSAINEIRAQVDDWRTLPPKHWQVTPETARLLRHWRQHRFAGVRPFFCQIEAVETAIWLHEVAPHTPSGKRILAALAAGNRDANPELSRLALKLATGSGKTTVMAMLIAWQVVNAVRRPASTLYSRGFLIVAPGITIKDRLRVLLPNDPENYYATRELLPQDMLPDIHRARIVITNYHAFKLREKLPLAAGSRALLQGRGNRSPAIQTLETEGQMLQRVAPELMGLKRIVVLNDEAHHCYREKPSNDQGPAVLKGEERREAERQNQAARLWISGLEAVNRKIGLLRVFDLSATPYFLRGSGYAEGALFHWTVSDFSLMDAIECGIVKLPRVPVSENIPGDELPTYRNLWESIRKDMPKAGRAKGGALNPLHLPPKLQTALHTLYGNYQKTFEAWQKSGLRVPPCFIVVCQNTAISKLVFDYIAGFQVPSPTDANNAAPRLERTKLPLFSNFDDTTDAPLPRPRTLLIDSEQLESDDALDPAFRAIATEEIDAFRRAKIERTGDATAGAKLTDKELLREVMNTVGKPGTLGEGIRCVVSVSMLTEGWDANTVTHILGLRAFGTQLLCEQVVGRALRRYSYELNADNRFTPEYADIFGVPFNFAASAIAPPPPQPPPAATTIKAMRPERDALTIRFPRILGYRVELPEEQLRATFTPESALRLTPELTGPTQTQTAGIVGQVADLDLAHLSATRPHTLAYALTDQLLNTYFLDQDEQPKQHLFWQLRQIVKSWLATQLHCEAGTYPAQLLYPSLAADACQRIHQAIALDAHSASQADAQVIRAILDPYNPSGSTEHVRFTTTRKVWTTHPQRSHLNALVLDSDWEAELCRLAETHPRVRAYVKNHNLGLEIPYLLGNEARHYLPDFILLVDDDAPLLPDGSPDLLNLLVEIKGYARYDAAIKKATTESYWLPAANSLRRYGRWAFAEFTDLYPMQRALDDVITRAVQAQGKLR